MSIVSNLLNAFEGYPFKLSEAYEACSDSKQGKRT